MKTFARILAAGLLALSCTLANAALTTQQLAAVKADIAANPDLNGQPAGPDGSDAIAALYNAAAAPAFTVWRTTTPIADIENAIAWPNFTPSDTPDGTQLWMNRALACQGKQFNLQIMIQGKAAISSGRANIRAGLQDATTNIPSGAGGAPLTGGWLAIKPAMTRPATRIERLFATGTGTAGNPGDLGFEGKVTYQDIEQARNS